MKSFERLLSLLATIHDPRRAEGKLYKLRYVLLFSILAIVSGANSYRGICTFIKVHRRKLNKAFKISWKRPPSHTAIRYILQVSTPEQKCIGQPEQKYITEPARRPPNWGLFLQSSGLGGIIRRRVRASPT